MHFLKNGLNEAEIEQLDTWLQQNNTKLPSLEAIDGLFTALVIAPEIPSKEIWLPLALGTEDLGAVDEQILTLIQRHYDEVLGFVGPIAELEALKEWAPLIFDANDEVEATATDTGYGQHWAFGFHVGMDELPLARKALGLDALSEDVDEDAPSPLSFLAPIVMIEEGAFPDKPEEKLTLEQLKALEEELLDSILELRIHFAQWRKSQNLGMVVSTDPKIGRNDPCTCGSGKKFKKCCG